MVSIVSDDRPPDLIVTGVSVPAVGAAGASIAVNGVCLTATGLRPERVLAGASLTISRRSCRLRPRIPVPSPPACRFFRRYDSVFTAPLTPKIPRPADRA
jgi:hypothetical protein